MARNWIQKHPKLVFMLIGLIAGLIVSGFVAKSYDIVLEESIKINEVTISEFKITQETQRVTINSLRQENNKLKTKSSTYKIVKPDGTIIERTSDSSESESTISEQAKVEYEKRIATELASMSKRIELTKKSIDKSNKKLHLRGGFNTDLKYEVGADYNIWKMFTIGGGMIPQSNQYSIGIGIQL